MARFTLSQTCCTSPAAMWFWAAAFVALYGSSLFVRSTWPQFEPYGDTLLLLAALGLPACWTTHRGAEAFNFVHSVLMGNRPAVRMAE